MRPSGFGQLCCLPMKIGKVRERMPLEHLLSLFPLALTFRHGVPAAVESSSFEDQADFLQMWTRDEHHVFLHDR